MNHEEEEEEEEEEERRRKGDWNLDPKENFRERERDGILGGVTKSKRERKKAILLAFLLRWSLG